MLIVQHVPWERPALIASALSGIPTRTVTVARDLDPLLPAATELAGLVVLGGPMNADDIRNYPGLAAERRLASSAIDAGVPTLGVCLGAQLLARALDARVERGVARELGWAPVTVHDERDPLVGPLKPGIPVLHWHADAFELPNGATRLASTEATEIQAFRAGNAWALQFHMEATCELVEQWLVTAEMQAEARSQLGDAWRAQLTDQTRAAAPRLEPAATGALAAFADLVRSR